jgi:hypothetical protein
MCRQYRNRPWAEMSDARRRRLLGVSYRRIIYPCLFGLIFALSVLVIVGFCIDEMRAGAPAGLLGMVATIVTFPLAWVVGYACSRLLLIRRYLHYRTCHRGRAVALGDVLLPAAQASLLCRYFPRLSRWCVGVTSVEYEAFRASRRSGGGT